ncbi:MAG: histidine--tRNA ligase [Muribaculaceae bacterium]|nr:histidine--tRNA ligase [Bacteroides sp.]MBD5342580.1 histidine--tRNA ligase [Bacteroides sp.]MBD5372586.1 histidine--tRNA ligase [Bacteroides sp.]MDE6033963.1 histidine--tRNA ligase [Muribaculaceae bacterium]
MKPSIPKGTRDFSPAEMARRNYIFDTIRSVFKLYGFSPIETPAMENLSTLMGKYGEEGDKLLFKILNSGDFLRSVDRTLIDNPEGQWGKLTSQLCEKGLRYDLTVPFARFVVMHRNELQMPFKRYQIQPVWRADRPQKGRYREFYQCDADVVGSDSLINEVELIELIDEVFARLQIRIAIKLNNRKVLAGIAELIGEPDKIIDITVAIDKLDKIGLDAVKAELAERGLSAEAIAALEPLLQIDGTVEERLEKLGQLLANVEIGRKGVEELTEIIAGVKSLGLRAELDLDVSLARGLNYYTGAIIEVKALDVAIGSITGGGRYDNLTGVFGMPGLSGVGISFGADRIYDVLNQLDLYPADLLSGAKLLFLNMGKAESAAAMKMLAKARQAGISAEIYPDSAKMKKQMSYADAKKIPFVAIIGESEMAEGKLTLKNMTSGEQSLVTIDEAIALINGAQRD